MIIIFGAALFHKVYNETYWKTAYDMQPAFNTAMSFHTPSDATVKKLLEFPWNGQNYSDNLWDLGKSFSDSLNSVLTVGLIQGKSAQEMSRALRDEALGKGFDKGKTGGELKRCQRLVRTESAYMLNQATKDMYEELGVEEYEFLGTLDSKTCDHCGGLDGKHYPVGKEKVGINYPPLHPYCRCTTVPFFDDDEEGAGERIARDDKGENYHVPDDMNYDEWRKGLHDEGKGGILTKNIEIPPGTDKIKGMTPDLEQEIKRSLENIMDEYEVHLDHFQIASVGDEKVPFQFVPVNNGGFYESKLVINSDYDFGGSLDSFTKRIQRNYNDGKIAARSVEGLISHEIAHVMSFQDAKRYGEFERIEEELREQLIFGISEYADSKMDGAESLAEAFVRLRNVENIPDSARLLVEKYTERWHRK